MSRFLSRGRLIALAVAAGLVLGGVGIGALVWSSNTPKSSAPQTTPGSVQSGKPIVLKHKSTKKPHYLFTLDAHAGSLIPTGHGRYRLVLSGVHESALYFTDRPDRQVGTVEPQRLLDGLLDTDRDPPNAAINALNQKTGHQEVMGVTLLSGRYDARTHTASFLVKALPQGPSAGFEHNWTDVVLSRTFRHTSLFIDDSTAHTCTVSIANDTGVALSNVTSSAWGTDSWADDNPQPTSGGQLGQTIIDLPVLTYESDGGAFRGCGNSSTWSGTFPDGTGLLVVINATDPWRGSNTYACAVVVTPSPNVNPSDQATPSDFKCGLEGVTGGDDLDVQIDICSTVVEYAWLQQSGQPEDAVLCSRFTDMDWLFPS